MSGTPSSVYTLSLVRVVSRRLQHITEEVIDAKKARAMVEEVAPGCLDAVALSILDGGAE
jgi:hypothetical protein